MFAAITKETELNTGLSPARTCVVRVQISTEYDYRKRLYYREDKSGINRPKCEFQSKRNIFIFRNIDIKMRKNLVYNIVLYRSETLKVDKTQEKDS